MTIILSCQNINISGNKQKQELLHPFGEQTKQLLPIKTAIRLHASTSASGRRIIRCFQRTLVVYFKMIVLALGGRQRIAFLYICSRDLFTGFVYDIVGPGLGCGFTGIEFLHDFEHLLCVVATSIIRMNKQHYAKNILGSVGGSENSFIPTTFVLIFLPQRDKIKNIQ
jgi:hypothetical protein